MPPPTAAPPALAPSKPAPTPAPAPAAKPAAPAPVAPKAPTPAPASPQAGGKPGDAPPRSVADRELAPIEQITDPASDFAELVAQASGGKEKPRAPDGKFLPTDPKAKVEPAAEPAVALDPETPAGDLVPEPGPVPELKTAKQLRDAYDVLKSTRVPALEKELNELKTQLKTPKADPVLEKERNELREQVKAANARLEEMETQIRFVDYTKSGEYQEKYVEPIKRYADTALDEVLELTAQNEDGSYRQATREDFLNILNLPTQKAYDLADQLFGKTAPLVLSHRAHIKTLSRARDEALDTYKARGSEFETKNREQRQAQISKLRGLWSESNAEIAKSDPNLYGEDPSDPEGNEVLAKANKVADAIFDPDRKWDPEVRLRATAMIKNQAAALPRTIMRLKKAEARISELETELNAFKESVPAPGDPSSEPAPKSDLEVEDPGEMLRKMAATAGRSR